MGGQIRILCITHFIVNKNALIAKIIEQLTAELELFAKAARASHAEATHEQSKAESKYDTFKLESSFLSRGLAKRVAELTDALAALQGVPLMVIGPTSPVQVGALVRLKAVDGTTLVLFLGAGAGGESISVDGAEINVVSAAAPLGQAVLDKRVGDTFEIKIGNATQSFTVLSVE